MPAGKAAEGARAAGDRLPVVRVGVEADRGHALALQVGDLPLQRGDVVGGVRLPGVGTLDVQPPLIRMWRLGSGDRELAESDVCVDGVAVAVLVRLAVV